jgi:cytochrome c oxidase cbb3-type subunit III
MNVLPKRYYSQIMWFLLVFLAAFVMAEDAVVLPGGPEDIARGKKLYMGACTYCHGPTGDGGKGADLSRRDLSRSKTDSNLANIIEVGIPGTEMPGMMHMTRREVLQTAAFVRTLSKVDTSAAVPGDAPRGQALYAKNGCANCHTIALTGGYMGPDLTIIGSRRNASHLRQSLLDPAAEAPGSFLHTTVTLKDGRKIIGNRLFEDTFTILVRDFSGGNHAIAKDGVQEIVKNPKASPMPSFRGKLQPAELDDLIAYLASLKERP